MVNDQLIFDFIGIPREELASLTYARYVGFFKKAAEMREEDGSLTFPMLQKYKHAISNEA